ncbi:hypothetical protein AA313_de0209844 [Arthrobotrys entomopaga]|nr:hypothetical protein AA313_de0209844 [Arthrobotrys entomopaga]
MSLQYSESESEDEVVVNPVFGERIRFAEVFKFPDNPSLLKLKKDWGTLQEAEYIEYTPDFDPILPDPDDEAGILRFVGLQKQTAQEVINDLKQEYPDETLRPVAQTIENGLDEYPLAQTLCKLFTAKVNREYPVEADLDARDETWGMFFREHS